MSKLWYKRGNAHQIGPGQLGGARYTMFSPNSFWNRKLAANHPIVDDGNDYATKIAHQARYSTNTTPVASYFAAPFQTGINTSNYSIPIWVMPAGYPTRKINFVKPAESKVGVGTFTAGSTTVTGVTGTWPAGSTQLMTRTNSVAEGTTISGTGSTLTLSAPAIASATNADMYKPLPDSWFGGTNLQAAFNAVPVPLLADLPAGWTDTWGTRLWAGGTDSAMTIWQPSTNKMWECFATDGNEAAGYTITYGGYINDVNGSNGVMPNGWGARATGLIAAGGVVTSQDLFDGVIEHAIVIALPVLTGTHIPPATRNDAGVVHLSVGGDARDAVPEGAMFRFPADIVIDPTWSVFLKALVRAIRDYGLIVGDGSGIVQFYAEDPRTVGTQFSNSRQYYMSVQEYTSPNIRNDLAYTFPWEQLQQIVYP